MTKKNLLKPLSPLLFGWLIAGFLVVGGGFTARAVEHSQHYSHQVKNIHNTFLCSWFCAAGQTLETHHVVVDGSREWVLVIGQWNSLTPQEFIIIPPISRAPPLYFLSTWIYQKHVSSIKIMGNGLSLFK